MHRKNYAPGTLLISQGSKIKKMKILKEDEKKLNEYPGFILSLPFIGLGSLLIWLGLQIIGAKVDDEDQFTIFRVWKKNF